MENEQKLILEERLVNVEKRLAKAQKNNDTELIEKLNARIIKIKNKLK